MRGENHPGTRLCPFRGTRFLFDACGLVLALITAVAAEPVPPPDPTSESAVRRTSRPGAWRCIVQGHPRFQECGVFVEVNRLFLDSLLASSELRLPLNTSGVNLVTLRPSDCFVPVDILIEFLDPAGPPAILQNQGGQVHLVLDPKSRTAKITVEPLSSRILAHISTGRAGGRFSNRDMVTGESERVHPAAPMMADSLKTNHPYDVTFSNRWYPVLRRTIHTGDADTSIYLDWRPLSKAGLIARSLVAPGWGHYYARRSGWWWPAGVGAAGAAAGLFEGFSRRAHQEYREHDQLCDPDSFPPYHCIEANRAWVRSDMLHDGARTSLLILGGIWAASVSDALIFWVDPWGSLTGIEGKRRGAAGITVRFRVGGRHGG